MIPPEFEYVRAGSLAEAERLLDDHGDDARLLAGGHSLIPLLRLRFAAPPLLVDVGRLDELRYIRRSGGWLHLGALSSHHDIEASDVIGRHLPLLGEVASLIGDPQVRNRGTIGGSLAHADPAGDYGAICLMLEAEIVTNRRRIPAREFFQGVFTTALEAGEILVEIVLPESELPYCSIRFEERVSGWAIVGVAAQRTDEGWRIGLTNVDSVPVRAGAAEAALANGATPAEAALLAADGLEPPGTLRASSEFKKHLVQTLTRRAVETATQRGA